MAQGALHVLALGPRTGQFQPRIRHVDLQVGLRNEVKVGEPGLGRRLSLQRYRGLCLEEVDALVPIIGGLQQRVDCLACGFKAVRWGIPMVARCPACDTILRIRTTLELSEAPGQIKLTDLGIAPREILAIRTVKGIEWIELSD